MIAAVFKSEIDREDTGVSGSGIDLAFLRADEGVGEDKDFTGSGETIDGDFLSICEGLALKSSGRVRVLVDLRTPVELFMLLLLFFAMVVTFMVAIEIATDIDENANCHWKDHSLTKDFST